MKKMVFLAGAAAAIAGMAVGTGIGAAANSHAGEVASLQHQTLSQRAQIARLQMETSTAQQQASEAQQVAASAQSSAQAQAKSQYASKMAQANLLLRKLKAEQHVVTSSTISSDGVYVVGRDIPSGTYHTSGGSECYYATLNSTNTFDIIDNNNFSGSETVDVSGAYAFQIGGGCTWTKIG